MGLIRWSAARTVHPQHALSMAVRIRRHRPHAGRQHAVRITVGRHDHVITLPLAICDVFQQVILELPPRSAHHRHAAPADYVEALANNSAQIFQVCRVVPHPATAPSLHRSRLPVSCHTRWGLHMEQKRRRRDLCHEKWA